MIVYILVLLVMLIVWYSQKEDFSMVNYEPSWVYYPSNYDVPNIDHQAVFSDILKAQNKRDSDLFGKRVDFKTKKNALRNDLINYIP